MFRLLLPLLALVMVPQLAADQEEGEAKKAPDPLHPRVKMETSLGDIVLELNAEKAPITVDNFLRYAHDGFYNGTIFHRVVHKNPPQIAIDVIQGGGFTPDMERKTEGLRPAIKNEWKNGLKNERGTISMARSRAPDSATSQFFINTADNQVLDMPRGGAAYAVFGKAVEGMDVVDKISNVELIKHPKYPSPRPATPKEPVVVKSVTLLDGLTYTRVTEALKPTLEAAARAAAEEATERAAAAAAEKAAAQTRAQAFKVLLEKGVDENGKKLHKSPTGLMYVILKEGDGPSPTFKDEKLRETTTTDWLVKNKDAKQLPAMDRVQVHYTGWLLSDGTQFDSSRKRGRPATFSLNGVIKGWFEGVSMMKAGGRRLLIIPPELAYGQQGRPGIPPNATLVFDIELLEVK